MKVLVNNTKPVRLSVVCCQHGDELIGSEIFRFFEKNISNFPGLQVIFAHEDAFLQKVRFIKTDLNRSYSKLTPASLEEILAKHILDICGASKYVLDLHTTTSKITVVPILSNLNTSTKELLSYLPFKVIVVMDHERARNSLIGNVKSGIALEYNEDFAKNSKVRAELIYLIKNVLEDKNSKPRERQVYKVNGLIPSEVDVPLNSNFKNMPNSEFTPFLVGEKSYKTFKAFNLLKPVSKII